MSDFVSEMFGAAICTISAIVWSVIAMFFLPIWTVIDRERAGKLFSLVKLHWKVVGKMWLRRNINAEMEALNELPY